MKPAASDRDIAAVIARLEAVGVHTQIIRGESATTTIGAVGDPAGVREIGLDGWNGVERVVEITRPYKLASSEVTHGQPSIFTINNRQVGGDRFCMIAGPCTVESREQTLEAAQAVAQAGASMLRAGAFKPRTSPFAFQGLGLAALDILAEARELTGLPIVSELTDMHYAEQVAEVVDVIQVGARNMQNYALLQTVGEIGKPVLLKRGLSATLEELLMAADYVIKGGSAEVILCERGIRTFSSEMRFTLDLQAIPWLKEHSHLPVIVDPSHAPGKRAYVPAISRAAAAIGADGVIVEVTGDPEHARCDGPQQLFSADFPAYLAEVAGIAQLLGRTLS